MKIEVTKTKKESEIKYPYIGETEDNSQIVLFSEHKKGVSLRTGEYSSSWNMCFFKPFTGTITLSND